MSRAVVWAAATAGAAATAAAMFLPWAAYGPVSVRLERLPNWGFYVTAAVALNVFVGWVLVRWAGNQRLLVVVGAPLEAAAIISAVVVMQQYDNGEAIRTGVVPSLGLGGPVAIVAALAAGTALAIALRAAKPASR